MASTKQLSLWRVILFLLLLPLMAIEGFIKAVFFPPKSSEATGYQKPTGYKWRDKNGVVHTHYYVYDQPPF